MGIDAKLTTDGAEELLRAPRLPSAADGTIRGAEAHTFDIVVQDLSQTGCFVETGAQLTIGSIVQLRITGLPQMAARVARRDGTRYGCEFLRALSPHEVGEAGALATADIAPFARSRSPVRFLLVGAALVIAVVGSWSGSLGWR